jgi:2,6-dihydroxypseudooxynicotine hydrolase
MTRARAEEVIDQNLYYDDPQLKRTVHDRKVAVFAHAATMLSPPLQPVSIPFDGIEMPGYLRLPEDAKAGAQDGSKPPPCVILLGGLDTTKEDCLVVNDLCVERGLATLAFDGPGQGETLFRMPWRRDFEQSVIAVLDFLEQCPQIDAGRIGIIGRSTGGYYAPKAASMDTRIRAAVAWGAMYHLRNLASIPRATLDGFVYVREGRWGQVLSFARAE